MDLKVSEELTMIQATVRRFVAEHLVPLEREHADRPLPADLWSQLETQADELGLWAAAAPVEFGGGGLGYLAHGLILEEAGRTILSACRAGERLFGGSIPEPLRGSSQVLVDSVIRPVIDRSQRLAWTPPRQDQFDRLRGDRSDGGFRLTGSVTGVEDTDRASVLLAPFSSDEGFFYGVVPLDVPGVGIDAGWSPLSAGPAVSRSVRLEGVQVSPDHLIRDGDHLAVLARWSSIETLLTVSRLVGLAERAHRLARDYAKQRVTFGRPLADRQAIQWKLVDADTDIQSARWLARQALAEADSGRLDPDAALKVRLFAMPALWKSIDEILQVFGGIGFTQDMPIEAMWRHIRAQLDRFGSLNDARQQLAQALGA